MSSPTLSAPFFVDLHCHLDLYPNHLELIRECERLKIKTLSVTNTPSVWSRNKVSTASCEYVRPALGLHPQLAREREKELDLFEQYLSDTRYVGEVGLDGSPEFSDSWDAQQRVFRRILECCARETGKILTIHSRRAVRAVIDMVGAMLPPARGKTVLHWFTGTKQDARAAIEAGCYFSVNIRMLGSARGRELIRSIPPQLVLTETDGPFIRHKTGPVTPGDVVWVVRGLGELWGIDEGTVLKRISGNLKSLLS